MLTPGTTGTPRSPLSTGYHFLRATNRRHVSPVPQRLGVGDLGCRRALVRDTMSIGTLGKV